MFKDTEVGAKLIYISLALLIVFALGVPGVDVDASISSSNATGEAWALVHRPAEANVSEVANLTVKAGYESFDLVQGTSEQLEAAAAGYDVQMLPERTKIHLSDWAFDTEDGEPPVPNNLRSRPSSGEDAYYLLQFIGPVKNAWLQTLEHNGIEVLDYVPNYTYVVRANDTKIDQVADLPEVQWHGLYHQGLRMSPTVRQALAEGASTADRENEYVVEFYGNEFPEQFEDMLKSSGLMSEEITRLSGYSEPRYRAVVDGKLATLFSVISETGFSYVAPQSSIQLFNHKARSMIGSDTAHSNRLTGRGQMVAVTDSGIDAEHEMFYDPDYDGGSGGDEDIPFPWPNERDDREISTTSWWRDLIGNPSDPQFGPEHRKIDKYIDLAGGFDFLENNGELAGDPLGHGTHVAGTIAGDAQPFGEWNNHDGHAFDSRLVILKAFNDMGMWGAGFDFYEVFEEAVEAGAYINNQSWGGKSSDLDDGYGTIGSDADRFMYDYPESLLVVASGNFGQDEGLTIATPGNAKNILTVGAVYTDNAQEVTSFSSRGPTVDGRLKPDLVAPGSKIVSAEADTSNSYVALEGTSMASPTTAGAAALVRQYYADGYYPMGVQDDSNAFEPSAALIKATLLGGAREITGAGADINDEGQYPNNTQGWGLLDVDNSLYWPGDERSLKAWDNPTELGTGNSWEETIYVEDGSQSLHLHLAWTDPVPTQGAEKHLVNDLNLELVAPDGTIYRGNNLTGTDPGYSVPDGEPDSVNNNEGIRLLPDHSTEGNLPEGEYTIRVVGGNVPEAPQSFSLVALGSLTDEWTAPEPPVDDEQVTVIMEIESMEIWEDVKEEIETLEERDGIEVQVTFPNE